MIDTKRTTRKIEVNGIIVTVKPYYDIKGFFEGYTAAAYNTIHNYPAYYNRRLIKYTAFGIDEYITAENIAHDFIEYRLKSTAAKYLDN